MTLENRSRFASAVANEKRYRAPAAEMQHGEPGITQRRSDATTFGLTGFLCVGYYKYPGPYVIAQTPRSE